jgi:hypothetical protein
MTLGRKSNRFTYGNSVPPSEKTIENTARSSQEDANPPPSIGLLLLGCPLAEHVEWDVRALYFASGLRACSRGGERVESRRWKHLGWRKGQVERHERCSVALIEVQPCLLRIPVFDNFVTLQFRLAYTLAHPQAEECKRLTYFEQLSGVVSREDGTAVCASVRIQLTSIGLDRLERK